MTRFGIPHYHPSWLHGRDAILAAHGQRLAALVGRTLNHVWLLWDLDDDTWFADAPVLLDFGDEQIALDHQKFDDLCVTWNTLNPAAPANFPDFRLAWRADPLPGLAELRGRELTAVELLEWWPRRRPADTTGPVDVGFAFAPGWLTVFNALDENGIRHEPPGADWRRYTVEG